MTKYKKKNISVYKRKLVSLLKKDSNFYIIMSVFLEGFDHYGICGEERYEFYSNVYKKADRKGNWKKNVFTRISEERLQHCFTKKFSDHHLFSVIFAYANNLSDKQIRNIANLNHRRKSYQILNDYLYEDIEHFVVIDNVEVKAIKEGTNIKVPSLNLSLEILDN